MECRWCCQALTLYCHAGRLRTAPTTRDLAYLRWEPSLLSDAVVDLARITPTPHNTAALAVHPVAAVVLRASDTLVASGGCKGNSSILCSYSGTRHPSRQSPFGLPGWVSGLSSSWTRDLCGRVTPAAPVMHYFASCGLRLREHLCEGAGCICCVYLSYRSEAIAGGKLPEADGYGLGRTCGLSVPLELVVFRRLSGTGGAAL